MERSAMEIPDRELHYWGKQFLAQFSGWDLGSQIRVIRYILEMLEKKKKEVTK